MIGLVNAMAPALGTRGIRINAVAPGTTPTPSTLAEWAHVPTHFDDMASGVPLGRLGAPEDIATTFLVLARDLRHVTGQCIVVDGGQTVER